MMVFIIFAGLALFGIFLFKAQLKMLGRMLVNLIIKDIAETPEGAEAVYNEMIDKAQSEYNQASQTYQSISEQLFSERKFKTELEDEILSIEKQCEIFVKNGRIKEAKELSKKRADLIEELSSYNESIEKLSIAENDAREMLNIFEGNLVNLKKEKQRTIQEIHLSNSLTKAYQNLDELKKSTGTEKLLDAVEEGAKRKTAMAAGAKAVYELKSASVLSKADKILNQYDSNQYIEGLIDKYESKNNLIELEEKEKKVRKIR